MTIKNIAKNIFYKQYMDYCTMNNSIKDKIEFKNKIYKAEANLSNDYTCNTEIIEQRNYKEPLITIITPTYNSAIYLNELRESLEAQDLANRIQWIVVDDASTDDTKVVFHLMAKTIKLNSYKFIVLDRNLGTSNALNIAAKYSDANILGWVSADDAYCDSKKLLIDLNLIKQGYDCIFSRYMIYGPNIKNSKKKDLLGKEKIDPSNENFYYLYKNLISGNIFNGSSSIFKKELFYQCGGFDSNLGIFDQDGDLWGKFLITSAKVGLSETKAFYRIHKNQTSNRLYEKELFSALVRIRFLDLILKNELTNIIQYFENILIDESNALFHYPISSSYFIENISNLYKINKLKYFVRNIKSIAIGIENYEAIKMLANKFFATKSFNEFLKIAPCNSECINHMV